ncbi:MAG: hypothetical protein KBS95_04015 [Alistipes sp.]|nr:hypothetical protein [Candidatus Alistipes equi]
MIVISKETDLQDFDIRDLILSDTKTNIIKIFNELKIDVPRNASKEELALRWESLVRDNLDVVLALLPLNELLILLQLLFKQQNEFVPWVSKQSDDIDVQDLYLTVTCEEKEMSKIYMTDSVRKSLMFALKKLFGTKQRIKNLYKIFQTVVDERFAIYGMCSMLNDSSLSINDTEVVLDAAGNLVKQSKKILNHFMNVPNGHSCQFLRNYIFEIFKDTSLGNAIAQYYCDIKENNPNGMFSYVSGASDLLRYSENKYKLMLIESLDLQNPIVFSDAFTENIDNMLVDQFNIGCHIERKNVLKVSVRLQEKVNVVYYAVNIDGHISLLSCWNNILDFVRNGLEDLDNKEASYEVKNHFRKKYPAISLYLSNCEEKDDGYVPYLVYESICNQPEMWWLKTEIDDADEKDFKNWCLHGPRSDDRLLANIISMGYANVEIFREINRSDAKTPKERMHSYFGMKSKPDVSAIDNLNTYLDENFEFEEDVDEQ